MEAWQKKRNEQLERLIPQRGEPPYFVHAGLIEKMGRVAHGETKYSWLEALLRMGQLSSYGTHASGQQIIYGVPAKTGLLTEEQIKEYEQQGLIVFDMNKPDDVALARKI